MCVKSSKVTSKVQYFIESSAKEQKTEAVQYEYVVASHHWVALAQQPLTVRPVLNRRGNVIVFDGEHKSQ